MSLPGDKNVWRLNPDEEDCSRAINYRQHLGDSPNPHINVRQVCERMACMAIPNSNQQYAHALNEPSDFGVVRSYSSSESSESLDEKIFSSSESDSDDSVSSHAMSEVFDDSSSDASNKPRRRKRVCFKDYCDDVVQRYSEKKFIRMFRLPRDIVNKLIDDFAGSDFFEAEGISCLFLSIFPVLDCRGLSKIPPHHQMYCFLYFVGHQIATYEQAADRFNLSADTVFNIVTRVADFIGTYAPHLIQWPSEEESRETQEYYEAKYGIPEVEGLIDGTQIKINKPPDDPESYYNRKAFFSLQMQVVCDHKRRIRHFTAGQPGSVHDARAYKLSGVPEILSRKTTNGRLLGDKAYAYTRYLTTPYKDNGHLLPHQIEFNKYFSKCRIDVEHTIGLLRQRFRILYHMRLQPGLRRLKVIRACVVLHNMALMRQVEYLEDALDGCTCQTCRNEANAESEDSDNSDDDGDVDDADGMRLRDEIAERFRH
ncbi:hypothetical protein QAD02_018439 [Eretmocerus hayati]|uniref:Uncharacterized protein n=1 Tax=Eretmocerus hayati TaxID=131215 RepID=A0ACC2PJR3_9HYME|nr:hypothetical protein QAD02_018439 [Eretmocerus hayati]